jgi:hypothetical protein
MWVGLSDNLQWIDDVGKIAITDQESDKQNIDIAVQQTRLASSGTSKAKYNNFFLQGMESDEYRLQSIFYLFT